jgi:hypothetical protein
MPFYEIINFHFSMKFCGPFQNAKLIQKAKLISIRKLPLPSRERGGVRGRGKFRFPDEN